MRKIMMALLLLAGCSRLNNPEIAGDSVPMEEVKIAAGDWPWWRGPTRDGHSPDSNPPLDLKKLVWKTAIPGKGHASPILWGERIFITTAIDSPEEQRLLCLDRAGGQVLWNTVVHQGGFMKLHGKNTQASATPATDGERVYTVFTNHDGLHVSAVDYQGQLAWQTTAGQFSSKHGYGSSPVIYQSLVIVAGDNSSSGFVAALHRKTGAIVWRKSRPNADSYGTPIVLRLGGRDHLVMTGGQKTIGYDPATGDQLWSCDGPAETTANTAAGNGSLAFVTGGYPQHQFQAIGSDGAIQWRLETAYAYVPSPLAHAGHLFLVDDAGFATCYDAASGQAVWKERLGGAFTASATLAGGNLYVPNEAGKLFILQAGPTYRQIATGNVGESCFASPVICGGRLYQRGSGHLHCFGP